MSSPDATRLCLDGWARPTQPHCFVGWNEARGPAIPSSFPGRSQSHTERRGNKEVDERDREPFLSPRRPRPAREPGERKTCPKTTAFPCVRSTVTRRLHVASRDIPESRRLLACRRAAGAPHLLPGPNTRRTRAATRTAATSQKQSRRSRPYPHRPGPRAHGRAGIPLRCFLGRTAVALAASVSVGSSGAIEKLPNAPPLLPCPCPVSIPPKARKGGQGRALFRARWPLPLLTSLPPRAALPSAALPQRAPGEPGKGAVKSPRRGEHARVSPPTNEAPSLRLALLLRLDWIPAAVAAGGICFFFSSSSSPLLPSGRV
jgi:hypothetical protein